MKKYRVKYEAFAPDAAHRGVIDDPDGYVNVRSGKRADAPVVAKVKTGEPFSFEREEYDEWCKVKLPSEKSGWINIGLAEENSSIKFPSPDGRFALRISDDLKVDLIEKASGKIMVDLGRVYGRYLDHPEETVLVWSADAKWAAYGTRGDREGEATVYFWNGSAFEEIRLPDDLPEPKIKFRKRSGAVKNYGGSVKPLRWLQSGELELSSHSMMLSRDDGATYTGVVVITVAFDAQHHVSVKKIGKTKTQVSE